MAFQQQGHPGQQQQQGGQQQQTRPDKAASIFVGNLAWAVTEQELGDLFAQVGQVVSVKIIIDRETKRSKGFGFVQMSDSATAAEAIQTMQGTECCGRPIRTDNASR